MAPAPAIAIFILFPYYLINFGQNRCDIFFLNTARVSIFAKEVTLHKWPTAPTKPICALSPLPLRQNSHIGLQEDN